MKKNIWILLIILVLIISGVLFWQFQLKKIEKARLAKTNCAKEVEYFLSEFPGYFESFEKGMEWCNECINNNGIPRWSPTGPFCSLKTSDGGKTCTDSSQCEGLCLAENENSKSGKCSDIKSGIGCVLEMDKGEVFEVCYD